jgi:hypothetical protein
MAVNWIRNANGSNEVHQSPSYLLEMGKNELLLTILYPYMYMKMLGTLYLITKMFTFKPHQIVSLLKCQLPDRFFLVYIAKKKTKNSIFPDLFSKDVCCWPLQKKIQIKNNKATNYTD